MSILSDARKLYTERVKPNLGLTPQVVNYTAGQLRTGNETTRAVKQSVNSMARQLLNLRVNWPDTPAGKKISAGVQSYKSYFKIPEKKENRPIGIKEGVKGFGRFGTEVLNLPSYAVGGVMKEFMEAPERKTEIGSFEDVGKLLLSPAKGIKEKNLVMEQAPKSLGIRPESLLGMGIGFAGEIATPGLGELAFISKGKKVVRGGVKGATEVGKETMQLTNLLGIKQLSPEETIKNFVNKFKEVFPETKDIRNIQEKLYSQERGKRFGAAQAVTTEGEKGFWAEKSKLKGQLPKAQFETIRKYFNQDEMDAVFKYARDYPYLTYGEKLNLREGLTNLLGTKGTTVPTKSQLSLLNEVYGRDFTNTILAKRPFLEKFGGVIGQVLSIPRSIMAGGLDMSFGLRQGIFGAYRYQKQWASSMKDQFKWFTSDEALNILKQQIRNDPDYLLARESKLAIPGLTSGREEQFVGTLAEKIPGLGIAIKATDRAYTGFAAKYRFDIFKSLVNAAKQTGDFERPNFAKSLANHVNTITSRGGLGKAEAAAGVASTTLFSPRLLASRLNLLNPIYYAKLDAPVRKEALKTLFSYIAGTTTLLGLAKLAGADVVTDPTNSDFLKIKKGNTRIDVMGGFQQPIVLATRLITGRLTSSTSGKEMTLGEGYKPVTRFDIMLRFFESKEAPVVSFLTSLMKGRTAVGEPFNVGAEAINRVTPMFISDMYDLWKEGNLEVFPIAGTAAFFGAGSQTYGKTEFVTGKNQLGQPTSQIRPTQDLGATIAEKVFGKQPLGSTSSWNAEQYHNQLSKLPPTEANKIFQEIKRINPDLADKMLKIISDRRKGVTAQDEVLKAKGVASGDRALVIAKELKKMKSAIERVQYVQRLKQLGVVTPEVDKQLKQMRREGKL